MLVDVAHSPADILSLIPESAPVLARYDIDGADKRPLSSLTDYSSFLVEAINGFEAPERLNKDDFEKWSVAVLLEYLERSHAYYLNKLVPEVEQSILVYLSGLEAKISVVLIGAFKAYVEDLRGHFQYEEKYLFPYSRLLEAASKHQAETPCLRTYLSLYSVNEFVNQHGEDEYQLEDFMSLLITFGSSSHSGMSYRIALGQLQRLLNDLRFHVFIEDEVLVTKLRKLEEAV